MDPLIYITSILAQISTFDKGMMAIFLYLKDTSDNLSDKEISPSTPTKAHKNPPACGGFLPCRLLGCDFAADAHDGHECENIDSQADSGANDGARAGLIGDDTDDATDYRDDQEDE